MATPIPFPEMDDSTTLARQIYIALQKQVGRQFAYHAVDYSGDLTAVDISATIDLKKLAEDVICNL